MKLPVHSYWDTKGRCWFIYKQTLPKKRGEWKYWIASDSNNTLELRGDSLQDAKEQIEKRFCKPENIVLTLF